MMARILCIAAAISVLCLTHLGSTESTSTSLIREQLESQLLLLSTLDGSLIGVDRATGQVYWSLKDEPVVKVPVDASKAITPLFLPDPKDGSLYVFSGSEREALKKLPFTIPQLVASSPCRSSDGILYTGKKLDSWFMVDTKTGRKKSVLNFDEGEHVCPLSNSDGDSFYIGRTEYNIVMLDSKKRERRWNVTFFDYSASTMDEELLDSYEMVHFMASSSGRVVTMDRREHTHLWSNDYGSPVIGVYVLGPDGLISCPFTSVAEDTLNVLADQLKATTSSWLGADQMKLQSTLYVGEHPHGLYALPSLVDSTVATIEQFQPGPLLLEGPHHSMQEAKEVPEHSVGKSSSSRMQDSLSDIVSLQEEASAPSAYPVIILGHYQMPTYSKTQLQISGKVDDMIPLPRVIHGHSWDSENDTGRSDKVIDANGYKETKPVTEVGHQSISTQTDAGSKRMKDHLCWDQLLNGNVSAVFTSECVEWVYTGTKLWLNQQENKSIKVLMALIIISMAALFCYVRGQMREFHQMSHGSRSGNGGVESSMTMTAQPIEADGGGVRVGKITFYTDQVLGKGCEGTFVYRGLFDGRSVAVKRLLPECFSLADREVALLRESDQHAHVVRYFCTEQDHLFRYIALELAVATLADLVEGRLSVGSVNLPEVLTGTEILRQATSGLAHLHSLDIVHRDIKPHNVLISMPNVHGEVRAMISDFGLCKKLQKGRMSFSRRSGVTGTDGWIAPEMLSGPGRTTCAVDIFSMGCVFYYVKTNGKHPFGDPLRRQANILNGDFRLTDMQGTPAEHLLTNALVERMLSWEPLERPPASAILSHPLFWSEAKVMAFFQDVSDRVERDEAKTSPVLQALELDGVRVVRGDWRLHICDEVAQDLRRYRNYRGHSVRDLLRALRNKKHHYRELSVEAQRSLGTIPDQFVLYWVKRFPRLLLHSWLAFQIARHEPVFKPYYHPSYTFAPTQVEIDADHDWESMGTIDGFDFNTATWQVLKRKESPKSTRKESPSAYRQRTEGKVVPKSLNWREQQYQTPEKATSVADEGKSEWGIREKQVDRSADQENWRSPHKKIPSALPITAEEDKNCHELKKTITTEETSSKPSSPFRSRHKKSAWKKVQVEESQAVWLLPSSQQH